MEVHIPSITTLRDVDTAGAFQRKASVFRNQITPDGPYPPASGRYILYVSYACPWASRCTAYRVIKGLEEAIELAVVSPLWARTKPDADDHEGWVFDPTYPGATADPLARFKSIRDVYELSMQNTGEVVETRFTVPVLFDRQTMTIVNNESSDILRMFNDRFNAFARHPERNFSPAPLIPAIDAMNQRTYEPICNGVYKSGFAHTQGAYEAAVREVFTALDEMDSILSRQRYLVGDGKTLTEADIRLFCCLVRFDEVYYVHFKCNTKLMVEYRHLMAWLRDVFQTLQLHPTVNMKHIKDHYYRCHASLNPLGIVPIGRDTMKLLEVPHGRS